MRCWDEQFWWIIMLLVDYSTLPCQEWVSWHSESRIDVVIWSFAEQFVMPRFVSIFSHWTNDGSDGLFAWLWLSLYIVLWLSLLLYSFWWHVLAFSVMIWRSYKYVDLDVSILCIWCPYSDLEVLDLYSLVLPSLGRIEIVTPTIFLAC